MQADTKKFIEICRSYLGRKESDGSYKEILDLYNNNRPAGSYKMTASDPWCAAFVSAMAAKAGIADTVPFTCSCREMIKGFENAGRYVEDDNYVPEEGSIIFYDWEGMVSFDSIGRNTADHVGVVVDVTGQLLTVIEGNKSDSVSLRVLEAGSQFICGFGIVDSDITQPETMIKKMPTIRVGSSGDAVRALQAILNVRMNAGLVIDGGFGSLTGDALRKFQKETDGLEVDTVAGPLTWAALTK